MSDAPASSSPAKPQISSDAARTLMRGVAAIVGMIGVAWLQQRGGLTPATTAICGIVVGILLLAAPTLATSMRERLRFAAVPAALRGAPIERLTWIVAMGLVVTALTSLTPRSPIESAALALLLFATSGFALRLAPSPTAVLDKRDDPDELATRIDRLLPQTQCGQCTYPGCRPYAEAIARGEADINQCPPGGDAGIRALAALLGRPPKPLDPAHGIEKPVALAVIDEATCIGCTKCIQACPVDAILGAPKLMHTVIAELCTGCELCLPPCPVDCIEMVISSAHRMRPNTPVAASNRD